MNAERWQQVQRLVEEALAQADHARREFLEAACGTEVELREEVASLLAAHERGGAVEELPTAWLTALARPALPRFSAGEA